MYMTKYMPDHFGAHGFKRPACTKTHQKTINIGELEEKFPAKKSIDLTKEGYDKLLGKGHVATSLTITVNAASASAIEKIKDKGGDVKLPE